METSRFKGKRLIIPFGMGKEIMKGAGCTLPTLQKALRGEVTGPKSKKARYLAEKKLKELENQQA